MQKTVVTMSIVVIAVFALSHTTSVFAGDEGSCASSCSRGAAKAADSGSQCPFVKAVASLQIDKSKASEPAPQQAVSGESREVVAYEKAIDAYSTTAAGIEDEGEDKKSEASECEKKEGCDAKAAQGCDKKEAKAGCPAAGKSCPAK